MTIIELNFVVEKGEGDEDEGGKGKTGANDNDDADDAESLSEENVENEGERIVDGVKVGRKPIQNSARGSGGEKREGSLKKRDFRVK